MKNQESVWRQVSFIKNQCKQKLCFHWCEACKPRSSKLQLRPARQVTWVASAAQKLLFVWSQMQVWLLLVRCAHKGRKGTIKFLQQSVPAPPKLISAPRSQIAILIFSNSQGFPEFPNPINWFLFRQIDFCAQVKNQVFAILNLLNPLLSCTAVQTTSPFSERENIKDLLLVVFFNLWKETFDEIMFVADKVENIPKLVVTQGKH